MSSGKEKCISTGFTQKEPKLGFQGSYPLRSHKANTFTACSTHSLRSFSQILHVELSFPSRTVHAFLCLQLLQSLLFAPDGCLQLAATGKGAGDGP